METEFLSKAKAKELWKLLSPEVEEEYKNQSPFEVFFRSSLCASVIDRFGILRHKFLYPKSKSKKRRNFWYLIACVKGKSSPEFLIHEINGNSFSWNYRPYKLKFAVNNEGDEDILKKRAREKAGEVFAKHNKNSLNVKIPLPTREVKSRRRFLKRLLRLAENISKADKAGKNYYSKNSAKTKAGEDKNRGVKFSPKQSAPAFEGGKIVAAHKKIERNPQFAQGIKNAYEAKKKNMPCQVCGFSFLKTYGEEGRGYIEAHHLMPLYQGKRETKNEDIALVCANCHRVIHRHLAKKPNNPKAWMLEIEGLKKILRRNRKG